MNVTDAATSLHTPGTWVVFYNQYAGEYILMLEPHGIDFPMQPDEKLYIYLAEHNGLIPDIHYSEGYVEVFAFAAVVYSKGVKLFDYLVHYQGRTVG